MKNFLKKNLIFIIGFLICLILILLGILSSICLLIGTLLLGVLLLFIAFKLKKHYNKLVDNINEDENVFDATKIDYDEDIYVVGSKPLIRTRLKQNFFSKLSALFPTILFSLFGVGLIIISLSILIKMIF